MSDSDPYPSYPCYFESRGGWILTFDGILVLSRGALGVQGSIKGEVEMIVTTKSGVTCRMFVVEDEVGPLILAFRRWLAGFRGMTS